MYYPQEVIDEVLANTDIVDVVSSHVHLKKRGKDYIGLCPFHNEKTPSFNVIPAKNMYYCFGCGAGGSAITFLMKYNNSSFAEALQDLADRAQITLPSPNYSEEAKKREQHRQDLLAINKETAVYYYRLLRSKRGERGMRYFTDRALSQETMKNFGLGMIVAVYLMNGWEKFGAQAKMIVYAIFPKKAAEWIQYEIHYTDRMFSGFIHGKILDSAIVGIICFIFTMFTGMPYALLVSVIVGVTNIIPFFGPYMGMIPSALLILTSSPWKCLVFLVFIILLQQVDGNVLGPRILGETVGISSFWILFSILFFGSIWGLVGMIVGVPLFAVIYDLISRGVSNLLRKRRQETMLDKYTERFHPEKAAVKNKTSGGKAARRKNKTTEDRTNNNQSR